MNVPELNKTSGSELASALIAKIQKIVGPINYQRPVTGAKSDKEIYLEALQEKYLK